MQEATDGPRDELGEAFAQLLDDVADDGAVQMETWRAVVEAARSGALRSRGKATFIPAAYLFVPGLSKALPYHLLGLAERCWRPAYEPDSEKKPELRAYHAYATAAIALALQEKEKAQVAYSERLRELLANVQRVTAVPWELDWKREMDIQVHYPTQSPWYVGPDERQSMTKDALWKRQESWLRSEHARWKEIWRDRHEIGEDTLWQLHEDMRVFWCESRMELARVAAHDGEFERALSLLCDIEFVENEIFLITTSALPRTCRLVRRATCRSTKGKELEPRGVLLRFFGFHFP